MSARRPRVGLFGLLGSGNIGNDASADAIIGYLRTEYPDATIDAMCMGWERMHERYGIATTPFTAYRVHGSPGLFEKVLAALSKVTC